MGLKPCYPIIIVKNIATRGGLKRIILVPTTVIHNKAFTGNNSVIFVTGTITHAWHPRARDGNEINFLVPIKTILFKPPAREGGIKKEASHPKLLFFSFKETDFNLFQKC